MNHPNFHPRFVTAPAAASPTRRPVAPPEPPFLHSMTVLPLLRRASCACLFFLVSALGLHAQTTAFTYQGRLNDGAAPANGLYDLRFSLQNAATGGTSLGTVTNAATAVDNGLFTVTLDFGTNGFPGPGRWLEIGARTNGGGGFTTLTPRQAVASVPYAIQALNGVPGPKGDKGDIGLTGTAGVQGPIGLTGATGPQGPKGDKGDAGAAGATGPQGPAGSKGVNWRGAWAAGTSYAIGDAVSEGGSSWFAKAASTGVTPIVGANWDLLADKGDTGATGPLGAQGPIGLTGTAGEKGDKGDKGDTGATGPKGDKGDTGSEGPQGSPGSTDAWSRLGNAGTDPDANFLGTTDSQSLVFRANNTNYFRLSPEGNVIFGPSNVISSEASLSTIAGGGTPGYPNRIYWGSSFIGAGNANLIEANTGNVFIGAGFANRVQSYGGFIGSGNNNFIGTGSGGSVVVGGYGNAIGNNAIRGTVPGGENNFVGGSYGFAAGRRAKANHQGAFVWADSTDTDFASSASDQFNVRADGGMRFETDGAGLTLDGAPVFSGFDGGALTNVSAAAFAGPVADGQLSANVALLGSPNTFTGTQTVTGGNLNVLGGETVTGPLSVGGDQRVEGNVGIGADPVPASKLLVAGTVTATGFEGDGGALTGLDAANLSIGTINDARLSANVAKLDTAQTFTAANTFTGTLRASGLIRSGSETGSSEAPNRSGLTIRRINSTSSASGQVVARSTSSGVVMTLERDGTPGGFLVRFASSIGAAVVAGSGIDRDGNPVTVYKRYYGGTTGTSQIFTTGQFVGHFRLSFGNPFSTSDMTKVVLTRFVDSAGNDNANWVGTVTSTVNQ